MKHTYSTLFAFSILAAIFTTACKKDPVVAPTPTGNLLFHMHTLIDTTEVDTGMVAADASGRHFQLDVANLLISGIRLKKSDGSYISVDNVYLLKTIGEEEYVVGKVPAGNYLSVAFSLGVDASANAKTPADFASPNPLADTKNWFGSSAQGYIFANIKGKADVSAGQTGPADQVFSYQLGTSTMLEAVSLPDKTFTVVANQDNTVHLVADYGTMLNGVDFKTQSTGTPVTNTPVVRQIAANIPSMFRYQE
jgi:hypothetical protein